MRVRKPVRRRDQDLRELPSYTIPEAAIFLGIPEKTLSRWFCGDSAVLIPASRDGYTLLSFYDLAQAYRIQVLRKVHRLSYRFLKETILDAKRETGSEYPLLSPNVRVLLRHLVVV